MTKKKLFILCGPAGCGKSTWVHKHKTPVDCVISRDVIRLSMLSDDEDYFLHEDEVYKEFIKEIKDALESKEVGSVFVDATHLNKWSRRKLLRSLGVSLKNIEVNAIALKVPLDVAIEQNSHRTGRANVPNDVIKEMYDNYTIPTIEEGFDVVWQAIYQPKNNTFTYVADIKDINEYYAESEV